MINQLPINSTHIALNLIQSQKKKEKTNYEKLIKTVHHDQISHLAIENITIYSALIDLLKMRYFHSLL
jgi:hypothetical protein